jgi:hypothetical protein
VSLQDLVSRGLLRAGDTLTGRYEGVTWEATVHVATEVDVVGRGHFKSLTAAAMHGQDGGKTANGWVWWRGQRPPDGRACAGY